MRVLASQQFLRAELAEREGRLTVQLGAAIAASTAAVLAAIGLLT